ncbi:unnamed protein product [Gongylonema pulchrum]|uniref:WD_REPEATS_REGION domain-containing protein n=1 Tax=Gongylonema pulchrum TaxID=637853 RepID=A0A183EAI8_9BILA|nr:unnamed protein product [Gongylonema pulchrum]
MSRKIGSVGYDTQLCLWDITEDVLRQTPTIQKHRISTFVPVGPEQNLATPGASESSKLACGDNKERSHGKEKRHKRGFSLVAKLTGSSRDRWSRNHSSSLTSEKDKKENMVTRLLGTPVCPRMDEVALIEPLVCKKIAHEKLTGLIFCEDCLVTACQEGFILTWARPGKAAIQRRIVNSPIPVNSGTLGGGGGGGGDCGNGTEV